MQHVLGFLPIYSRLIDKKQKNQRVEFQLSSTVLSYFFNIVLRYFKKESKRIEMIHSTKREKKTHLMLLLRH